LEAAISSSDPELEATVAVHHDVEDGREHPRVGLRAVQDTLDQGDGDQSGQLEHDPHDEPDDDEPRSLVRSRRVARSLVHLIFL
jgi:hypothetical protein